MRILLVVVVCTWCACGSSTLDSSVLQSTDSTRSLEAGRYVKVSNAGQALGPTAQPGSGASDWACTWDSRTGLLWEMKTLDGSVHDALRTYSWFEPGSGATIGWRGPAGCGSTCDTRTFTSDVNRKGLCGAHDWRLPHRAELESLVWCSAGRDLSDDAWVRGFPCADFRTSTSPRIDSVFFPNIVTTNPNSGTYFFWSDDTYDALPEYAFHVNFRTGATDRVFKSELRGVRLVRHSERPSSQPMPGLVLSWGDGTAQARVFVLSRERRVSLVATGHFGPPRWVYRTVGSETLADVACESSADPARCQFEIPAWAQPGRYELLVQARDQTGGVVTSAPLLAELVR